MNVLLVCGCTSVVAIGTAYDSAASQFTKALLDYADFNRAQKKEIKARVSAFHQWHRKEQLPHYVDLLRQIADTLTASQLPDRTEVSSWVRTARSFPLQLNQCNPLNQSSEMLGSLSEKQLQQVEEKIQTDHSERVAEYESETTQERLMRRKKTLQKWARRAGVPMNEAQSDLLQSTLEKQISLSPKRQMLWLDWSDQLLAKIRDKNRDSYNVEIDRHITTLWTLTEQSYPELWQRNIELWQEFLIEFSQLITKEQAERLSTKLTRIANSVERLHNKPDKGSARCYQAIN